MPPPLPLQDLCVLGSEQLVEMRYLEAEATLAQAEAEAWAGRDWDTLARLYMPLQEARRQRRQRCGEGVVALDLIAHGPHDVIDGRRVVENFPHGQLLVAGWRSIQPAIDVRRLAAAHGLYVETFLGAAYPVGDKTAVAIVPLDDAPLPTGEFENLAQLERQLPTYSLVTDGSVIVRGQRKGTPQTFGEVMALWERLHAPFLVEADAESDPVRQIERYRLTTRVDYASELAHQKLSDVAHRLARDARIAARGA
jgi:hypothetical protein